MRNNAGCDGELAILRFQQPAVIAERVSVSFNMLKRHRVKLTLSLDLLELKILLVHSATDQLKLIVDLIKWGADLINRAVDLLGATVFPL